MRAPIGRPGHFRRLLATAAIGLGGALAIAPAASADHFAGVDAEAGGDCVTAVFGSFAGFQFRTDDWRVTVQESGKVRLVCRFASLPASWDNYLGERVELPRKLTDPMSCSYAGDSASVPFTTGEFRILPNGTGMLRCTWPPPTA